MGWPLFITDFITNHRSWLVVFVVLPLSLLFDLFFKVRAWCVNKFFSAPALHEQRVAEIQRQLKAWNERMDGTKLCTARGGWESISPGYRNYKSVSSKIRISLYDILDFCEKAQTITVEPMVNMGTISHFLIPRGYTLPVLPEMDDLTVGGLYMGVGIETSSHKYGLFNDSVVSAKVVLSSGEVVTCSPNGPHADLFDALPWSYGTLGFLVEVTLRVIPCKPWIRIEYIPFTTKEEGVEAFSRLVQITEGPESNDFVEALQYSKDNMVVMPANFATEEEAFQAGATRNIMSRWWKPWFYKHCEWMLNDGKGKRVEYIPLRDYYHRHTRSIFWELEQILPVGNHWLFRLLLGWAVPPKVSFLKLTQTEALRKLYEEQHVIQDMLVPITSFSDALKNFDDNYDLYPLWLCPYKAYDYGSGDRGEQKQSKNPGHRCFLRKPQANKTDSRTGQKYEMYVDLGAYGIPKAVLEKKPFDAPAVAREVEDFVLSQRGFQMLYADSYLSKTDFYKMFDHSHYTAMKKHYDPANGFPEVYEKVCKAAAKIWKERGESKKKV